MGISEQSRNRGGWMIVSTAGRVCGVHGGTIMAVRKERWNAKVSVLRARVEHPTAMMKQQLGYRPVRYRGTDRSEFDLALTLTACNLKKSLSLKAA